MVAVNIDKKEIREGIKEGIYTKMHKHYNPYPDIEDPDDYSGQDHSVLLYINQSYTVAGVKSFFGDTPPLEGNIRVPIYLYEKIDMKYNLYMLTQNDFTVLKVCDGFNSIENIAEITQIPLEKVEQIIDALRKKRLVQVIKRSEV
ncbi:MAG: winged helix-turn-helix domain-containing protein [Promethearchaeota archaeon]